MSRGLGLKNIRYRFYQIHEQNLKSSYKVATLINFLEFCPLQKLTQFTLMPSWKLTIHKVWTFIIISLFNSKWCFSTRRVQAEILQSPYTSQTAPGWFRCSVASLSAVLSLHDLSWSKHWLPAMPELQGYGSASLLFGLLTQSSLQYERYCLPLIFFKEN